MTKRDPFDDPDQLRLPPEWLPKYAEPIRPVPKKIRKRNEQFVMVPLWWYGRLTNPCPRTRCTGTLAMYVLHMNWKHHGKPFALANGMLEYDGISSDTKTRALKDLEQRGLVAVQWRDRKSPIVTVNLEPLPHQCGRFP
jgi:hypothetical protein